MMSDEQNQWQDQNDPSNPDAGMNRDWADQEAEPEKDQGFFYETPSPYEPSPHYDNEMSHAPPEESSGTTPPPPPGTGSPSQGAITPPPPGLGSMSRDDGSAGSQGPGGIGPMGAGMGDYGAPGMPGGYGPYGGEVPDDQKKVPAVAYVALVLGALGLFCTCTSPIAVIVGIIALISISSNSERYKGRWAAVLGLVLGALPLLTIVLFLLSIRGHWDGVRVFLQTPVLSGTVQEYRNDHDGANPPTLQALQEEGYLSTDQGTLFLPKEKGKTVGDVYHYRGGDLTSDSPGEMVLLYSREPVLFMLHGVVFNNLVVDFLEQGELRTIIDRDNKHRVELGLPGRELELSEPGMTPNATLGTEPDTASGKDSEVSSAVEPGAK